MSNAPAAESPAKPGWTTSEFWVTVSTAALTFISFLVSVGLINSADQEDVSKSVSGAIGALGSLVANAFVIWRYIQSRVAVKVAVAETQQVVVESKARVIEAELRTAELIATMPEERLSMVLKREGHA